MFPGWGFASQKGKLAQRSREWFRKIEGCRIYGISLQLRTQILRFGADCYRAGYRAARASRKSDV